MNNTYKRVIAIICILVLFVTLFASCKSKEVDNTTASTTTSDPFADMDNTDDSTTTGLFDDFATPSTTAPTTTKKPTTTKADSSALQTTAAAGENVDYKKLLAAFGYSYDANEDCFYSTLNPWQMQMGFAPQYDKAGAAAMMHYITFTTDFTWGGEDWRLQFWKGNYGAVLNGAEIGVYTKHTDQSTELYDCADNDHLLNMSMVLYSQNPTGSGTYLFTRPAQDHWWLTGFKVGSLAKPGGMVLIFTINFRDYQMANAFVKSLEKVSGQYAYYKKKFQQVYSLNDLTDETFYRNDTAVTVRWRAVGDLNYDG